MYLKIYQKISNLYLICIRNSLTYSKTCYIHRISIYFKNKLENILTNEKIYFEHHNDINFYYRIFKHIQIMLAFLSFYNLSAILFCIFFLHANNECFAIFNIMNCISVCYTAVGYLISVINQTLTSGTPLTLRSFLSILTRPRVSIPADKYQYNLKIY